MRGLKAVLTATVFCGFSVVADATVTAPVADFSVPVRRCVAIEGDNPFDPKVVPNLSAGREELQASHFARAAAHFRPLAEDGNTEAQRELGTLLQRDGCNIPTDKAAGLSWLRKAAEKDDAAAQLLVAQALLHGSGAAEDDKGAYQWAKRAAKTDLAGAQALVGELYFAGRGVKANVHEGIVWTVKAAEQGTAVALATLAKSYLNGSGVNKDLHQAMFLIALANQRIPPGQYLLNTTFNQTRFAIASRLSVEEVRATEKDAEKWSPGKGALAKVLADAEKWTPEAAPAKATRDVAEQ